MNNKLSDQQARDRIASDLDTTFMVEAGAGSGKTTSLVTRFVSLIKSGKHQPGSIAAITFTRRAASELRERIQSMLEKQYRSSSNADKKKLGEALNSLDRYYIGTIHSFCARLLRERPVEFGLDPEFQELEDLEQELFLNEVWDNYLLSVKLDHPKMLHSLLEIGVSPLELKKSFQLLNQYPEISVAAEERPKPDLKPALDAVAEFVDNALQFIPDQEPPKGYDKLQNTVLTANNYLSYLDTNKDLNRLKILSLFEASLRVTLNRWEDKDQAREYRDSLADKLKDAYVLPALKKWREYCYPKIIDFISPVVEEYRHQRIREARLDFQDLLLITARSLQREPELRSYYQERYSCLLIDEFQDTDHVQAEIAFYLTGTDNSEQDWRLLEPRAGSLFLVGDPKQSIYRFRRADIDIYNLVRDQIIKSGGQVLELTSNFRSLPPLAEHLNPIFRDILPAEGNCYQAEFAPMKTVRGEREDTESGIRILPISADCSNKGEVVREDARLIASIITSAVKGGMKLDSNSKQEEWTIPDYKDFLILLRYKDSIEVYARTLKEYGIPVDVTGGSTFDPSCTELKELYRLLRFLNDISNEVLLVGVLRGLFFGFSDDDLYQFHSGGGYYNIYTDLPDSLSDGLSTHFDKSFDRLKRYYKWSCKYTPATALEKIVTDLGLIAYTLSADQDESNCENIYYLLEEVRKLEIEGELSFRALVDRFSQLLDTSIEEELYLSQRENAVRLMNLHRAKGLEASIVFLAHPYKYNDLRINGHIKRIKGDPEGYFLFQRKINRYNNQTIAQPRDWEAHLSEEEKYQLAEQDRLLYVAATRAKNLLIISCSLKNNRKNPWKMLLDNTSKEMFIDLPEVRKELCSIKGEEGQVEALYSQKNYDKWIKDLSSGSYHTVAVTELVDKNALSDIVRDKGGGKKLGTAAHKLMESLIGNNVQELDTYIDRVLVEYDLGNTDQKKQLKKMVDIFMDSDFWIRINRSEQILTEVPFSLKVKPEDSLYQTIVKDQEKAPVILYGVIDLVFKEEGGWVLIDYKTDRVKNRSDQKLLEEIYNKQVEIYGQAWRKITGEEVKEKSIYLLKY